MARPLIISYIESNHESIECNFYGSMAGTAYSAALGSLFTGQFYVAGGAALIGGAASLAAQLAGCNDAPPPPPGPGGDECWKIDGCDFPYLLTPDGDFQIGSVKLQEITKFQPNPDFANAYDLEGVRCGGGIYSDRVSNPNGDPVGFTSGNCTGNRPGEDPPPHNPGEPIAPPQTHQDDNGCNWTIQATDAYVDNSGGWHTYYSITADNDACGGPFGYWSSKQGPQWVQPNPIGPDPVPPPGANNCPDPCPPPQPCPPCPDPCTDHSGQLDQIQNDITQIKNDIQNGTNCPDPCKDHTGQLNSIESAVDEILGKLSNEDGDDLWETLDRILLVTDIITNLLGGSENGDELLPGVTYTLQGVCEPVGEGEPQPIKERQIVQASGLYGVIARVDALMLFMQDHLGYRTPTCAPQRPELAGTWISTRWISDSDSPAGERPLRKLFRYRSKSTRSNDQLREYWSEFAWQAGSVMVQHKGAWWGTPQVWASSEAEGKRVLRFAAGEAGINPDLDGEWIVGGSSSPRFGQSGTMRLQKPGGTYWVVRRDGSDGYPE